MRALFVTAALGAAFGAAIAISVTTLRSPRERATPPPPAAVTTPVVIPSSWDRRFLTRLSEVESRLQDLEKKPPSMEKGEPAPPRPPDPSEASTARTREIEQQYLDDLERQATKLSEHNQEPLDETWARPQGELITRAFNAAVTPEHPLQVRRVDCKKATCVAELVYPSPTDAVADRDVLTRTFIAGCHGLSSALNPPTGPGEYSTTIIYNCR